MNRPIWAGAALVCALTLSACSSSAEPIPAPIPHSTPTQTLTDAPTAEPTRTVEPGPSTEPAALPSAALPSAAAPPTEPPPPPTEPAATTAGGLSPYDVGTADGWEPVAKPGSAEEGFMGNGTWVHATSAEHSAFAAIALGCTDLGPYPLPMAALEGNLADDDGNPGVGLTLEFSSRSEAETYFAEWLRQAEACVGSFTEKLTSTSETWVGLRHLDTTWSETAGLRGNTVRFLIVQAPDADLSNALGAP